MNFQQLEYIIAVDRLRHFAKAANACFVTQPTLSMMIQKLEEELGVLIFDRKQKPITPTKHGQRIIQQAKIILKQKNYIFEIIQEEKDTIEGQLLIGIIPTLAPYLIPLFIQKFTEKYPLVNLTIEEINTNTIIEKLKKGELDLGILATPLEEDFIDEIPLFYEEFFLYATEGQSKKYVLPEDINFNRLLLLEEGHCLRSQVVNLCKLRDQASSNFSYKSGSLETLKRLVEKDQDITILPELALKGLDKKRISPFESPPPSREISIIKHRSFIKEKILVALQEEIVRSLPRKIRANQKDNLVKINE